jgi:hypothetical protein
MGVPVHVGAWQVPVCVVPRRLTIVVTQHVSPGPQRLGVAPCGQRTPGEPASSAPSPETDIASLSPSSPEWVDESSEIEPSLAEPLDPLGMVAS